MIALLREVEAVARRQQASAAARLFDQFARESAEREAAHRLAGDARPGTGAAAAPVRSIRADTWY
jgi:hypothetical protein